MPRGKNYVNNNKGVSLQANPKVKANMQLCEYGAGCTRPDCIYRHEGVGKKEDVCLPFLAGKCTFKDNGCRKRHPKKEEKARLIAKYKRTRCRHGDVCYTDGCLYLHPKEMETEPSFVEPHNLAFPPLSSATASNVPKPVSNSAWKAAPVVVPAAVTGPAVVPLPSQPAQQHPVHMMHPPQVQMEPGAPPPPQGWNPMYAPQAYYPPSAQYFDASGFQGPPLDYYGVPMHPNDMPIHFNAEAKEFVPGNSS